MSTQDTTPKFASMSEVVMKKEELVTKLVENKAKHDTVLATAIQGYWELAKDKMAEKRKQLEAQLGEWREEAERAFTKIDKQIEGKQILPHYIAVKAVNVDTNLNLIYPEDHSQDYERAIRMMEASVFDQVQLTVDEFDAYVLNNWEWKKNFLAANTLYVDTYRGKYKTMVSGVAGAVGAIGAAGPQGSRGEIYNRAAASAVNQYAYSGISNF